MATHDYIISNASGAAVRADLNNALAAIATNNSSATEPTTTYAYQWWADTGSSPTVMKLRNAANSGWITLFQLDGEWTVVPFENGTAAAPSIYFKDSGTDTGIYSPGTDQVGISAGGTSRFEVSTSATTSTLPVVHPLGAVGTPSITFTGDLNTGIWSPAADTVAVSTNGTRAITIDSSQRLGIGTTPLSKFHVNLATNENIHFSGGSGDTRIGSYNDAFNTTVQLSIQGSPLLFRSAGGLEAARIDSSSRLLVGTSSSVTGGVSGYARLQVLGNSAPGSAGVLNIGSTSACTSISTDSGVGYISFSDSGAGQYAWIACSADGTSSSTSDTPGRLGFFTTPDGSGTPTERMRITNGGITSTFTTAGNAGLWIANGSAAGTSVQLIYGTHSAGGVIGGTNSFTVWTNGNVQNTNGSYTTLSDVKLKENIVDAGSQWDDVKAVRIRKWNFKAETGHETHRQIGPIAQELETVCPGLVFETPDRDADGNETGEVTKGVNQSVLYMKAVKALQEAMERIEQLEAKVAALESA